MDPFQRSVVEIKKNKRDRQTDFMPNLLIAGTLFCFLSFQDYKFIFSNY